jgi:membrane protein
MERTEAWELLKQTSRDWSGHNVPRLGASLAFYTLLSLAPLLILVVTICALVFTKSMAEASLVQQAQDVLGATGAKALQSLIENSHEAKSGIVATIIALITLLFGASGVFVELRDSLNLIWDVKANSRAGWRGMVWQRLTSFGMVLALGFLLLVSLILSAGLGLFEKFFTGLIPVNTAILGETANFIISLLAIAVLFGLIFKFVPEKAIAWRDVIVGAVATAVLFTLGRTLLALYLSTAGVGSTYGAAGSLVALVVWVYYSAQIFFFGAIFTRVYAERCGSYASRPVEIANHGAKSATSSQ